VSLLIIDRNVSGHWVCELNRPEKLNALSKQLVSELLDFFKEAQSAAQTYKLRVLTLKSSQTKAFCVGADLLERKKMNEDEVGLALDSLRELTSALAKISCPTIAFLEGAAFGGGLELALCCDLRVCSPQTQMGLTETRLAIIPGAGGTQRLTRLLGESRAKELIYTGKKLSGVEAATLGLVNACVADPKGWLQETVQQILDGGPVALRAAKQAIEKGLDLSLESALDQERVAYNLTLKTKDRIEGLQAFEEKRKARYQGQ
jgi:methylglutaconyl-CoA hydratase